MARKKTLSERRKFKQKVHKALFQNEELRDLLIGGIGNKSTPTQLAEFKKVVMSHMFVDDTELEAGTYIYYDVQFPVLNVQIKNCEMVMYAICNRKIIADSGVEGYSGDRIDRLGELIEDSLINDDVVKEFGIGDLKIDSIRIFNGSKFYGLCFTFKVPNFR